MRLSLVVSLLAAACCPRKGAPPSTLPPASQTSTYEIPSGPDGPVQSMPCDNGRCATGLTCLAYAGKSTCEIPCAVEGTRCPLDQSCVTVADGPGQVCRPRK